MQWMRLLRGKVNNRGVLMSLLALGVGFTALGITRRSRLSNIGWRQMLSSPIRKMF